MKRAIVLSGGGGKGAYQIGVWKALRKLNISYDIVTGTSVGALNGALMVQKTFYRGYFLWNRVNFDLLFKEAKNVKNNPKDLINLYGKNIVKNGGMDVSKLEALLEKYINKTKFFNSNVDFGLVTVQLPELKPIYITKKEMKDSNICDYLMASATCYPAFKKKKIKDKEYIDGGIFDNFPINLAIDLGADEIIAVDLKAIGIKRKIKNENIPITYISPSNSLAPFLVFDKDESKRAIKLGYNDTLKAFGKLEGNHFSFYKHELERNYHLKKDLMKDKLINIFSFNNSFNEDLLKIASYKRLIDEKKSFQKQFEEIVDFLGISFKIDPVEIYNIKSFEKELWIKYKEVKIDQDEINKITSFSDLKKILSVKSLILYLYHKKVTTINDKDKKDLAKLALLFPKETLAAIYLSIM